MAATGLVLGIETATALGGVALVSAAGELHGEITLRSRESHAERILPAVDSLLETLGAAPSDIAGVAVSSGPGSFTGLRAGIAAAKGLAYSLGVPLYGVATLEALAANAPEGAAPVCAVLNARRGEVYRAFFLPGPDGPERLGADALVALGALAAELPAGCLVVGELPDDGLAELRTSRSIRVSPSHLAYPRASVVAGSGRMALAAARASELATLAPRYLRAPDAQPQGLRAEIACADAHLRSASLTPPAPSASMKKKVTARRGRDR